MICHYLVSSQKFSSLPGWPAGLWGVGQTAAPLQPDQAGWAPGDQMGVCPDKRGFQKTWTTHLSYVWVKHNRAIVFSMFCKDYPLVDYYVLFKLHRRAAKSIHLAMFCFKCAHVATFRHMFSHSAHIFPRPRLSRPRLETVKTCVRRPAAPGRPRLEPQTTSLEKRKIK